MTILGLIATSQPVAPPPADPAHVLGVPTTAPWHMAEPASITGYDGTDETVHPTVVDFGSDQAWNGYRFWMCHTPYPTKSGLVGEDFEDPCIAASNDCLNWTAIGPQPLDRWIEPEGSTANGFHSDPEMLYNPAEDRLELWYRAPGSEVGTSMMLKHSHSSNGADWTPYAVAINHFVDRAPCAIRFGDNDWRLWAQSQSTGGLTLRTATSSEGPWGSPSECAVVDMPPSMWHPGMTRLGDGTIIGLAHHNGATQHISAFRSDDGGQTFTWVNPSVITPEASSSWARTRLYRPCLVPHENGTHARVWYAGGGGPAGYVIGYTELPLSIWG